MNYKYNQCKACAHCPPFSQETNYRCLKCNGVEYFNNIDMIRPISNADAIGKYLQHEFEVTKAVERQIRNARGGVNGQPSARTRIPEIKNVIFNDPATIVFWADGTKTVVQARDIDEFDPEKGLTMAIAKKLYGNKGSYYNEIKKWLPEEPECDRIIGGLVKDPKSDTVELNFIFKTRGDAEGVIIGLMHIIDLYEVATVADLYNIAGLPSAHLENKWGWTSLRRYNIIRTKGGYLVELPMPILIGGGDIDNLIPNEFVLVTQHFGYMPRADERGLTYEIFRLDREAHLFESMDISYKREFYAIERCKKLENGFWGGGNE